MKGIVGNRREKEKMERRKEKKKNGEKKKGGGREKGGDHTNGEVIVEHRKNVGLV